MSQDDAKSHTTLTTHTTLETTSETCFFLNYRGKRTSKIRPEFVIFDPQVEDVGNSFSTYSSDSNTNKSLSSHSTSGSGRNGNTDTSESESDDLCRELYAKAFKKQLIKYFFVFLSQDRQGCNVSAKLERKSAQPRKCQQAKRTKTLQMTWLIWTHCPNT